MHRLLQLAHKDNIQPGATRKTSKYLTDVHLLNLFPKTIKNTAKILTAELSALTQVYVFCCPIPVIHGSIPQVSPNPTTFPMIMMRTIIVAACPFSKG